MRTLLALVVFVSTLAARMQADSPATRWDPVCEDRFSAFLDDIYRGDIHAVRHSLDSGMNCDWRTSTGLTPLMLAVALKNDSLAFLLMDHGAKESPNLLVFFAITGNSLPLLKRIDKQGELMRRWDWGNTHFLESPLVFALANGSMEVIDYLFSKADFKDTHQRFFMALSMENNRLAPREKASLVRRLLKAGAVPEGYEKDFEHRAIVRIAEESGDTAFINEVHGDLRARQFKLNNMLAWRAQTMESVDSLLALGADPIGPTHAGHASLSGSGCGSKFTPLDTRRGTGCIDLHGFRAFNWQVIDHFVKSDPLRVIPKLDKRDHVFIAVTTGDYAKVKLMKVLGKKQILEAATKDGKQALSLAADAGDARMVQYLLQLPFGQKEREGALYWAVVAGALDVVQCLLKDGVDPRLPTQGGDGIVKLISAMMHRKSPRPADTAIATLLLTCDKKHAQSGATSGQFWQPPIGSAGVKKNPGRSQTSNNRLPMTSYLLYGSAIEPVLFRYLWNIQPGSLDSDTLFSNIGYNPDLLSDTAIMRMVTIRGHEDQIVSSLIPFHEYKQPEYLQEDLMNVEKGLAVLNQSLDRGVALADGLKSGWYKTLGNFQIGYDTKKRRFALFWIVPSLFSELGSFEDGGNMQCR